VSDGDLLIAVNERDEALGPARRGDCHAGAGVLHRAFSVYLFDARGALLQRRSEAKRLWPLFWSNACCSNPRWGEAVDAEGSERELCSVWVGRVDSPPHRDAREIAGLRLVSARERLRREHWGEVEAMLGAGEGP
jgi:isopentenyl-diphosphate delta-isomerase type 1